MLPGWTTPVAVANGGTNATTAATARASLGTLASDGSIGLSADWTAGNHTITSKNSVDWINPVVACGVDPTGNLANAHANAIAINACIAAMTDGQTLQFPEGSYAIDDTILVGNGSASGVSSYNFITLRGVNPGHGGSC